VSAVDVKTMKVVARIPVGEQPGRMTALLLSK
jgi:YVTN family beta-propeller protein